ncbi:FAD-binding oxidoreductase [Streptomyces sp. Ncost-T10-10d]|uniref:FAD-binding oxidoreductase n=1 Tax=Streptomyces sp. Ncost-T10-10d TaxID=1839774 RepID=UPI00081E6F0D|nr:FAD-binding oxidoreductase [Streptomyces sp. Ncost-T10-10d]SCF94213.1 FAD/FMN-containing dehydrogenase [Streptomyces sp. Ncost-T10-10d]
MNLPPLPDRRTLLTAGAAAALTGVTTTACSGASVAGSGTGDGGNSSGTSGATGGTTPASPASSVPSKPSPSGPVNWSALAKSLDGTLVRPQDAAYPTARQLYNTRFDGLRPAAVAYVRHAADIRECLAFARRTATPVSIRSGGHSYAGWSSGNGRLVLDVSSLSRVDRSGTIGAGAKLIDVYQGLARNGLTIPGGSCPTVGISGLTLGGGHGVASRAYGLTCDSLTAATVVTADGKTLVVDAKHHPDLFWALRGAGNGNFGVVTELTFCTRPAPQTVTAYMSWPWSRARAVIQAWQEWGPSQPDEIWSSAHLAAGPGGGHPTVSVAAFSLGTYGDLQNAVDRLADRIGASASSVSLRRRSYQEAMLVYAGCSGITDAQCHLPGTTPGRTPQGTLRRETYAAASDFYDRSLSPAGVNALLDRAEAFTRIPVTQGGGGGSIALTALGGAINRVSPQATAFVHRRSRVLAQYIGAWSPGTAGSAQQDWLKNTHAAMRRYASGAAYQNYTDPALTDWRRAYYGSAADRLTQLKKQYDPGRLFAFPQAL